MWWGFMAAIRILVVDDHAMLREGVTALLASEADIEIVGEAADGIEAVERYERLRPDIMLLDMQMPRQDGAATIRIVRERDPKAKIVVLTTYDGDVQASRALKAGASGYLLKSSLRHELLDTIREVYAGRRRILPEIAQQIALHAGEEPLSERELEVLRCVAVGSANKQIARTLSIAEDTVKTHLRSIFFKLNVKDRTEAVVQAARRRIIEL
jgi:DNA-binding NarL/FixJ family response regulator